MIFCIFLLLWHFEESLTGKLPFPNCKLNLAVALCPEHALQKQTNLQRPWPHHFAIRPSTGALHSQTTSPLTTLVHWTNRRSQDLLRWFRLTEFTNLYFSVSSYFSLRNPPKKALVHVPSLLLLTGPWLSRYPENIASHAFCFRNGSTQISLWHISTIHSPWPPLIKTNLGHILNQATLIL